MRVGVPRCVAWRRGGLGPDPLFSPPARSVHATEEAEHAANVRTYGSEDEVKKKSTVLVRPLPRAVSVWRATLTRGAQGRFLERILQRLCVTVERIHLQYEDGVSNPKQPYTLGLCLASLRYQGRANADVLEAMREVAEVGFCAHSRGRGAPGVPAHTRGHPLPRTFRAWTRARSCTRT